MVCDIVQHIGCNLFVSGLNCLNRRFFKICFSLC